MVADLKLTYRALRGQFSEALAEIEAPIAEAASRAVREAGDQIKSQARAEIAAAGFSKRWQNALRVEHFPRRGESIDAAAYVYHRIRYSGVFEEGAEIGGRPILWLPLENVPQRIGRTTMSPELFRERVGRLQYVQRDGQRPLLVAPAGLTKSQARRDRPKVSLAALRRGSEGGAGKVVRTVPVFVGVRRVRIPQKFSITGVVDRAAARLGELYVRHFGSGS